MIHDRGEAPRDHRAVFSAVARCLVLVVLASGCVRSQAPLITPETATFPWADAAHFRQFTYDPPTKQWISAEDATLTREKGRYSFVVHGDQPSYGLMMRLGSGDYGELYLVQGEASSHYEYGVAIVNAAIPTQPQSGTIALLGIDCPAAATTDRDGDCEVSDLAALTKMVKATDWKAKLDQAETIYRAAR